MKTSRRAALVILLLGFLFLLALTFPAFIQDNLVTPIALVLWLFWRILQSIDQAMYWILAILLALGYFLFRLIRWSQGPIVFEQFSSPDENAMLERIGYWRSSIHLSGLDTVKPHTLERELGMMLAALYASKQPESVQFEIYDDLKRRAIPLPEPIYAFLFPVEATGSKHSIQQILRHLRDWPRKQVRRWTGREKAAYYQSLEQVITFLESELENQHDDEHRNLAHR